MSRHRSGPVASSAEVERRWNPRVEVIGRIKAEVRPHNVPIVLLNLSHGGFLMRSPIHYPVGEIHKFRFAMAEGDPIMLRARVVHALRVTTGHVECYETGLEFVDQGTAFCHKAIASLVKALERNAW